MKRDVNDEGEVGLPAGLGCAESLGDELSVGTAVSCGGVELMLLFLGSVAGGMLCRRPRKGMAKLERR